MKSRKIIFTHVLTIALCLHYMLRIALYGDLPEDAKYFESIRKNQDCILTGICTKIDLLSSNSYKLIDHPVAVVEDFNELLMISDAIVFLHHQDASISVIEKALKKSKHIFVYTNKNIHPEILKRYHKLADEAGVLFYIHHKPIKKDLEIISNNLMISPEYIDIFRYADETKYNSPEKLSRLILEETIFLCALNQQNIKKINTVSIPYCSELPYFINIRIEFSNSTIANLTINKSEQINSRYSEIYFHDQIMYINTLKKNIKVKHQNSGETQSYPLQSLLRDESDPSIEINRFINKLLSSKFPSNPMESGINVYLSAWEILKKVIPAYFEK